LSDNRASPGQVPEDGRPAVFLASASGSSYPAPVPEKQLHLFRFPRPFEERFGNELFRKVPACPGVYIMTGAGDRVLYIGQSANLRRRLASYKQAVPDRAARKVVRLVRLVERVSWETCDSLEGARLRENELLRLHRPSFNRLNTYPIAYGFIGLLTGTGWVELSRVSQVPSGREVYGAFKSHLLAGYSALLRLTWAAVNLNDSCADLPRRLLSGKPPGHYRFQLAAEIDADVSFLLRIFLNGHENRLSVWIRERLRKLDDATPFDRIFYESALEQLEVFFHSGPERNKRLCQTHGLSGDVIPQALLDDLLTQTIPPAHPLNPATPAHLPCPPIAP
jgi:predicted GIY-YIG superfamily endonuclease